jgi:hypothetical protein
MSAAGLVLAMVLAVVLDPAIGSAQPAPPAGWKVERESASGDATQVCVASRPADGETALVLVAMGPLFTMVVRAPDFPTARAAYQASLSFDGAPAVTAPALGDEGVMEIRLGRGGPAQTVASSSKVSVTIDGRTHEYSLQNASGALDAVARCAGVATLSEQAAAAPLPIPGGGAWKLDQTLPGLQQKACSARNTGKQIDTILMLNDKNELLLIGGHPDWATWGGDVPLELSIDGAAPITFQAGTVENLILVRVTDPAVVQKLRDAKALDWTIPSGRVHGEVAGLGAALDAVVKCRAAAPAK